MRHFILSQESRFFTHVVGALADVVMWWAGPHELSVCVGGWGLF